MKTNAYLFSSESVSAGHPDKISDQISDAILDAYLAQDPESKVACEVLITTNFCCIAGEVTSKARVDAVAIAKEVIKQIGYDNEEYGFDYRNAVFENRLHQQSTEILNSVIEGGAGDQGLMFGYACLETPEYMPLPIALAHRLIRRQEELRRTGVFDWLLPDAKAQVTVLYMRRKPLSVHTIVFSTQHKSSISPESLQNLVKQHIIKPVIEGYYGVEEPSILINPSGSFTIGGPNGDTGLTGRKIIVDTYGGRCPHGGGALSGKDPSKVDRSAAYMARYIAKHLVVAGIAEECTVQLAYAIGKAEPVSVLVDTHETGHYSDTDITQVVRDIFDLTPAGIISKLNLKNPIYQKTANHGHFGVAEYPWEIIDRQIIEKIKKQLGENFEARSPINYFDYKTPINARKKEFATYSIEQLVALHNSFRKLGIVGQGRALEIKALHDEIARRDVDASAVLKRNEAGIITGCRFSNYIGLAVIDGKLTIIELPEIQ